MIRVYVKEDFMANGVRVYVTQHLDEGMRLLHRLGGVSGSWEQVEPGIETEPTFQLEDDAARPLLDALMRHYQGAEDTRTLRKDYEAERARVNSLLGTLQGLVRRETA